MYLDDDVFRPDKHRWPKIYYQKFFPQYLKYLNDYGKIIMVNSGITAIDILQRDGCPDMISFDNDLGQKIEGYHVADWIVNKDIDTNQKFIPRAFNYVIHSQNPIASRRIKNLLDNYLNFRSK